MSSFKIRIINYSQILSQFLEGTKVFNIAKCLCHCQNIWFNHNSFSLNVTIYFISFFGSNCFDSFVRFPSMLTSINKSYAVIKIKGVRISNKGFFIFSSIQFKSMKHERVSCHHKDCEGVWPKITAIDFILKMANQPKAAFKMENNWVGHEKLAIKMNYHN